MTYSKISGTGSYLPKKMLTNFDLEKQVDTTDQWIVERTGIKERHIIGPDEGTVSMSVAAAKKALEAAGVDAKKIELIIVATTTPDKLLPCTACLVQAELGLTDGIAFDIVIACAGFSYGLAVADNFIRTHQVKCALVIGTECLSRIVDWTDRSTCVLFGDGSGAAILEASDQPGILSTHLHAAGQYGHYLESPTGLNPSEPAIVKMQGKEVFKLAVNKLGALIEETLSANKLDASDLNWLIPHQANLRIIQAMAKKFNLPMEQVVVTVDKHANTSSASIPLALDEAIRDGRIKRGQLLLLESFGGGMSWGSALIRY